MQIGRLPLTYWDRDVGQHQARSNWDSVSSGGRSPCWGNITGSEELETYSLAVSLLSFLVSLLTVTGPRDAQRPSPGTARPPQVRAWVEWRAQ